MPSGTDRNEYTRRTLRHRALLATAALLLVWGLGSADAGAQESEPSRFDGTPVTAAESPDGAVTWIVAARAGRKADQIARRHGARESTELPGLYSLPAVDADRLVRSLRTNGLLLYAEPDVVPETRAYPEDGLSQDQWWLQAVVDTGTAVPPEVLPNGPRLALVAPGVYGNHPDLKGIDLKGAESGGLERDRFGTAAAGIAASPGGGNGIVGIWPGMNLRHAPSGDGSCLATSEAVRRAARLGSDVIVMGYGFKAASCRTHLAATQYAVYRGAILVAASGDGGSGGSTASLRPAIDPHVITVGSVERNLSLAPFSNTGPQLDLTAPGTDLLAPALEPSGAAKPLFTHSTVSGTAYSATMVAAAVAWLRQVRKDLDPSQVEGLLAAGASDLGERGWDERFGAGLLDIDGAIGARAPAADRLEPNDDIGWVDGRLLSNGKQKIRTRPLWPVSGPGARTLQATLSRDDPADVYLIRIPARSKAVIAIAQAEGDVAVEVRSATTRTIASPKGTLAGSDLAYPNTEGLLLKNRARDPRPVYLVVRQGKLSQAAGARYRVTVGSSLPG
ncbi:MAG: S8 family peptidase [Solirubrobacterales bacterium]